MTNANIPPPPPTPDQTYKLWSLTQAHLFASDAVSVQEQMKRTQDVCDKATDNWVEMYKTAQKGQGLERAPDADRLAFYEQRLVRTGSDGTQMLIAKTIELWGEQKAQLPWEYEEDAVDAVELGARGLPEFVVMDALQVMAAKGKLADVVLTPTAPADAMGGQQPSS